MKQNDAAPFKGDPAVEMLLAKQPSFGIVLVANWPPPLDRMQPTYDQVVRATKECFEVTDQQEACYFYPTSCLHITVATFHDFKVRSVDDPVEQEALVTRYQKALNDVGHIRKTQWQFRPKSAELHTAAAVMLWEETTGGLDEFRDALRDALKDMLSFVVPNICHSTYLRFSKPPKETTRSEAIALFNENVVPLMEQWDCSFPVDSIKLVVSRVPYMHPPTEVVSTMNLCLC